MKKLFLLVILAGSFAPHSFSMEKNFQNERENIEKKINESENIIKELEKQQLAINKIRKERGIKVKEDDSSKIKDKIIEHFKNFVKPYEEALFEYLDTCNHSAACIHLQKLWKKEQENLEEAGITMSEYMRYKKVYETIVGPDQSDTFHNQLKKLIIDKGQHEIHERTQEFCMLRNMIARPLHKREYDDVIVDNLVSSCATLLNEGSAKALEIAMEDVFNFCDFIKNCDDKKKLQEEAKLLAQTFEKLSEEKKQQDDNELNEFNDELIDARDLCKEILVSMLELLKEKLFSLK